MSSVGLCQDDWWKVALNISVRMRSRGLWAGMRRLGKPYRAHFYPISSKVFLIIPHHFPGYCKVLLFAENMRSSPQLYYSPEMNVTNYTTCSSSGEFPRANQDNGKRDGLHVGCFVWLLNQVAEYSWDEKFNILNFFLPHLNIIWTRFKDAV